MFKQTATDLTAVSKQLIEKWLNSFDTVLSDCDGVQWAGRELLPGSKEVTNRLQKLGKKVYFVTNMSVRSRSELHTVVAGYGYNISVDKIVSSAYATARYLQDMNFDKKVYLVGSLGISRELEGLGIRYIDSDNCDKVNVLDVISNGIELDEEVGAVIVSFDQNFSYSKMLEASNYLKNPECLFIATNFDELYPTKNGTIVPAIGPIIRAIEVTCKREAKIIGKPNPNMCKYLLDQGNIIAERTLMIGDSAKYDILFGYNCGFQTLLVGSGVNGIDDVYKWQKSNIEGDKQLIPDTYLPTLGDLLPFL